MKQIKMYTSIQRLAIITCIALTVWSCGGGDDPKEEKTIELEVNQTALTLDDNNRGSFSVTSNTSWTVTSNADWLSCSPNNGSNNMTINISATSDNTTGEDRSATLTIKDTDNEKDVRVNVTQRPTLDDLDVVADFIVAFTDGFANDFRFGKRVSNFTAITFKKIVTESLSDNDVISSLLSEGKYYQPSTDIYNNNNNGETKFFTPNSEYVLYVVGIDDSGNHGNLFKKTIKTKPEGLPLAEITNISTVTNNNAKQWSMSISLRNNAARYFGMNSYNNDLYQTDDHIIAYFTYRYYQPKLNPEAGYSDYTSWLMAYNGPQLISCTWAVDASGNIGNYCVARSGDQSKARAKTSIPKDMTYLDYCPSELIWSVPNPYGNK